MFIIKERLIQTLKESESYSALRYITERYLSENEDIYKDCVIQYGKIKSLVEDESELIHLDTSINYSRLEARKRELESSRGFKYDLLELDLYWACIDQFYILKTYIVDELEINGEVNDYIVMNDIFTNIVIYLNKKFDLDVELAIKSVVKSKELKIHAADSSMSTQELLNFFLIESGIDLVDILKDNITKESVRENIKQFSEK